MNYLAHASLSFGHPLILTGNMINDFIKGKRQYDYPAVIQSGMHLHRAIDRFTDSHAATAEAKLFFKPAYRLYAGPFVDIVYDHFLALDRSEFIDEEALLEFSGEVYGQLAEHKHYLPPAFDYMFTYMRQQNWLYQYREPSGIRQSFRGLAGRAKYLNESDIAFRIFEENYHSLQKCYNDFFPQLRVYAFKKFAQLTEK